MPTYPYLTISGQADAPICQVTVAFGNNTLPELGLFDSGAGGTTLTKRLVSQLGLQQYSECELSGATGEKKQAPVYIVDIQVGGIWYRNVYATLVERSYMLIGRDILNQRTLLLDGPRREFEID